ncbi:ABC transporter permease [Paracoccus onubensis]|uniref:ABC transporter permease n=1 Tax=Paracoccus onubensis TaxID=1675788 RepID=UPI00272F7B22|nr:ABC transporter permease [Paracoccus onubensis]MDP0930063.1 ABC transporter permease [Paracoccus onubensis]
MEHDIAPQRRFDIGRILRREPLTALAVLVLLAICFMAIFAPWLGTTDPIALGTAPRMASPSAEHWFGADQIGRDLYTRVLYGARVSLIVGIAVSVISIVIGLAIGLVSGAVRWLDGAIMRVMDGLMSIPSILLAIALVAIIGGSLHTVIIAITIVEFPRVARMVRANVLSVREHLFVEAAVTVGSTMPQIIWRHILPNTVGLLVVQTAYIFAQAIMIEAGLSFIGAGVPPETPSWGNIMAEGRVLWQVKPGIVLIPAAFLTMAVLAVNIIGDSLRDALDPRQNH